MADHVFSVVKSGVDSSLFSTWQHIHPTRIGGEEGEEFSQLARLVHELRLENKPEGTIWKQAVAALRCFKRALDLDRTNTKLWIEYGSIAFQLHSHASRQIKQHNIFGGYGDLIEECRTHREDMLKLAGNCYCQASLCDQDINDEQWLHHYMLGKVTEKFRRPIHECVSLYELASEYLYEDGAKYPKRIIYGTNNVPPHLAVESLEVFYRLHAVITKFIMSGPKEAPYEFLLDTVKKASKSPFAVAQEKSEDTSLDDASFGSGGKGKRGRTRELDHSYFRTDSMDKFLRTDMENSIDLLPSVVTNQRTGVAVSVSLSDSAESQSPLQGRSLINSPIAAVVPSQSRFNQNGIPQESAEAGVTQTASDSAAVSSEQKQKVAENNTTIDHDAEAVKTEVDDEANATAASAQKAVPEASNAAVKDEVKTESNEGPHDVQKDVKPKVEIPDKDEGEKRNVVDITTDNGKGKMSEAEAVVVKEEPELGLPESSLAAVEELNKKLEELNAAQPRSETAVTMKTPLVFHIQSPTASDQQVTSINQSEADSKSQVTSISQSQADSTALSLKSVEDNQHQAGKELTLKLGLNKDNGSVGSANQSEASKKNSDQKTPDGPSSADIAETTQALKALNAAILGSDNPDSCMGTLGGDSVPGSVSPDSDESSQDSTAAQLEKLKSELLALNQVTSEDPPPPVPDFPAWKSEESERESDDDAASSTNKAAASFIPACSSSEYTVREGQVVSSSETATPQPEVTPKSPKAQTEGFASTKPDVFVRVSGEGKSLRDLVIASSQSQSQSDSDCIIIDDEEQRDPIHLPCDSPTELKKELDDVAAPDMSSRDGDHVEAMDTTDTNITKHKDEKKKTETETASSGTGISRSKDGSEECERNSKSPTVAMDTGKDAVTSSADDAKQREDPSERTPKTSVDRKEEAVSASSAVPKDESEGKKEAGSEKEKESDGDASAKKIAKDAETGDVVASATKTDAETSKTSKKASTCGPPMSPASDDKNKELLAYCIRAYLLCLARFPQHFKCLYRLSHIYYNSRYYRNIRYCRDYLLGVHQWHQLPYMTAPGLFQERKPNNFFQNLWKIPIAEIDRAGSFAAHLVRSLLLLFDVLRDEKNPHLLFTISQQLFRTPDAGKKYLLDTLRLELANRSFEQSLTLVERLVDEKAKESHESIRSGFVILMYKVWQQGIKMDRKTGIGERVNKLFPQIYAKCFEKKVEKGSSVLEQAIRYCQQILLSSQGNNTVHTPSASDSFGSGGPLASSSPARAGQMNYGEKKQASTASSSSEVRQPALKGVNLLPPGGAKYSTSPSAGMKRPLSDTSASQAKVPKTSETKQSSEAAVPKLPNLSNLMQSQAQLLQAQSMTFTPAESAQYAKVLSQYYGFPQSDAQAVWSSLVYQSIQNQNPTAVTKVMMLAQQQQQQQSSAAKKSDRSAIPSSSKSHTSPLASQSKPGQKFDPLAMQKLKDTFKTGLQKIQQKKRPDLSLVMPSSSASSSGVKSGVTSSALQSNSHAKMLAAYRPGVFSKHGKVPPTSSSMARPPATKPSPSPNKPKADSNSKVKDIMDKILASGGVSKSLQVALKTVSERQKELEMKTKHTRLPPATSPHAGSMPSSGQQLKQLHSQPKVKTPVKIPSTTHLTHVVNVPSKTGTKLDMIKLPGTAPKPRQAPAAPPAHKPRTVFLPGSSTAVPAMPVVSLSRLPSPKPTFTAPKRSSPVTPKPVSPAASSLQRPLALTIAQPVPHSPLQASSAQSQFSRMRSSSSSDCIIISGTDDDEDDDDIAPAAATPPPSKKSSHSKYENDSDYVASDDEDSD